MNLGDRGGREGAAAIPVILSLPKDLSSIKRPSDKLNVAKPQSDFSDISYLARTSRSRFLGQKAKGGQAARSTTDEFFQVLGIAGAAGPGGVEGLQVVVGEFEGEAVKVFLEAGVGVGVP